MKEIRNQSFNYIVIIICQMLITNFIHFGSYIFINILPILIITIPLKTSTIRTMIIAFIMGLSIDFLADGVIGLNTIALVPIAFLRKGLILAILGQDVINRSESISTKQHGLLKITAIIAILQFIFTTIYVLADTAGTRSFNFHIIRIICSSVTSIIISIIINRLVNNNSN